MTHRSTPPVRHVRLAALGLAVTAASFVGCASYQRPFVDASGWQPGCAETGVGTIGMRAAAQGHAICVRALESARMLDVAEVGSIGLGSLHLERDRLLVGSVQPGSPAEQAGIGAGDQLLAIDGAPVRDVSLAQRLLFGRAQTSVGLLLKQRDELLEVSVVRAPLPAPPAVATR